MKIRTDDLRIITQRPLISPAMLLHEVPLPPQCAQSILDVRRIAANIIHQLDDRLLVIVGPCSIHDPLAALDYAKKLQQKIHEHANELHILMRVYFEKPRTTVGWKGLINDPDLDNSFNINHGLRLARKLLCDINLLGVPAGTEFLDSIIPQYISDLICWGAIGARTTESQTHRELASGLSMPIGFKNGTNGNINIAVDAITSASHSHHFLGVTKDGITAITATRGNQDCHIILRGGKTPNYDSQHVAEVSELLQAKKINQGIMIDCSHSNSQKNHRNQKIVVDDVCQQIAAGNHKIIGVMLESNLLAGNQPLTNKDDLIYGQSITDACIDWAETECLLAKLAASVAKRRQQP